MNIKELRIGNWISNSYFPIQVTHIALDMYGACEGIPLTPEILEKCGFDLREAYSMNWGEFKFWTNDKLSLGEDFQPLLNELKYELKYLHQLQNLIFSLIGEELNYTP